MESTIESTDTTAGRDNVDTPESPDLVANILKGIPINSAPASETLPASKQDYNELQVIALTWLSWQCRMVSGGICGALFLPQDSGNLGKPLAQWSETNAYVSLLTEGAELTQEKVYSTIRINQLYGGNKGQTCDLLAFPLLIDGKITAIISLMISPRSQPQREAVLQLLEWGMQWLEALLRQEVGARREINEMSLQLLSTVLVQDNSKAAMLETANILADQFGCDSVSIGLCCGFSTRLVALSHVSHFDERNQLIREIEAAMDEAVDQSDSILYQTGTESSESVVQAHISLAEQQGCTAIYTIPLSGRASYIGAITCEWGSGKAFSHDNIVHCETVAGLVGPVIEMMVQDERSLLVKGMAALRLFQRRLLGLAYLKLKITVLSVIVLLATLSVVQGDHQVKASATLQGKIQQLLVAPQDGYVSKGIAKAGDIVEKGDLLATLDDSTLQLERHKWLSERNKLKKQYQQALSKRERSLLGILKAQIAQVTAEIALIDDKIVRMMLRAPFDGVVVSGDLSQTQGAPVMLGQVLFEVTPLNNYRVMLNVDEHDIGKFRPGLTGRLVMTALPQNTFSITLGKVIPVAISSDGYNYFRVEAQLEHPSELLRPGMRGVAKVTIEQRDLLWVWSSEVVDRLRLWAWSLGVTG